MPCQPRPPTAAALVQCVLTARSGVLPSGNVTPPPPALVNTLPLVAPSPHPATWLSLAGSVCHPCPGRATQCVQKHCLHPGLLEGGSRSSAGLPGRSGLCEHLLKLMGLMAGSCHAVTQARGSGQRQASVIRTTVTAFPERLDSSEQRGQETLFAAQTTPRGQEHAL